MKITLINGWQTWWRWWSTWFTFLAAILFNIDTIEAFLYAWNIIPYDLKLDLPPVAQKTLGTVTLIIAFVARFPRQRKAHAFAEHGDESEHNESSSNDRFRGRSK